MLGFSIADGVAVGTLCIGIATVVWSIRTKAPALATPSSPGLPSVHPEDTLMRQLRAICDASNANAKAQLSTCEQLKRIADEMENFNESARVEREVQIRLRRDRGQPDG